jgi:hypothetical protein
MNRRQFFTAAGKYIVGAHAAAVAAPVLDFFIDAPNWHAATALRGLVFGHGQAAAELLMTRPAPGWPYLHALCHAFAVASMRAGGATAAAATAWSEWGGVQDEIFQTYWANFYRREIHPRILRECTDDAERDTVLAYLWGTPHERRGAEKKCRISRGKSRWVEMRELRKNILPLIDAAESAWQKSDETDNAIGRRIGLYYKPGPNDSDEFRLAWCKRFVRYHGIFPDTPEGPDTARPWGPFHPRHPGPGWDSCKKLQGVPWSLES